MGAGAFLDLMITARSARSRVQAVASIAGGIGALLIGVPYVIQAGVTNHVLTALGLATFSVGTAASFRHLKHARRKLDEARPKPTQG
jgi:hypothetical protein